MFKASNQSLKLIQLKPPELLKSIYVILACINTFLMNFFKKHSVLVKIKISGQKLVLILMSGSDSSRT